ncbi:hypothetical protein K0B90_03370 [bacterium]|nr:hypothetical protein [bacterium]
MLNPDRVLLVHPPGHLRSLEERFGIRRSIWVRFARNMGDFLEFARTDRRLMGRTC